MKKYLLILVTLMILTVFLAGESTITIDQPASGESWQAGTSPYIKWTKSGSQIGLVKIRLYNSNQSIKILDIDDNIPNNGSYQWNIPADLDPGNYVIRVRTMDNQVTGNSKVFIITSSNNSGGSNTPSGNLGFQKSGDLKMKKITVEVTKPKAGTSYWEGSNLHIRWKSKHTGAWKVSLFRDGTNKVADLTGGSAQHSGNLHQLMVKIPAGVSAYPFRKFKVRVGAPNPMSKIVGWSPMFNIKAPQSKISYAEYPSEKHSCGIGKSAYHQWIGNNVESGTATTFKRIAGTSRVGFENNYEESGGQWIYLGYVYRGWIKFDLSKLEGIPGYVTKAILKIKKHKNLISYGQSTAYTSCCNRIYKLNAVYSGNACMSLPAEQVAVISVKDGKTHWEVDVKGVVRNWLNHPETNFGFLLIPYNEGYEHTDSHCVSYLKTQLIVDYVESKK